MKISLNNKVFWVTGGGEGIGRGIALLAAQCGARVAVTGRDVEPLQSVVAEIEQGGGEALAVRADVSQADEVQSAVEMIDVEELGTTVEFPEGKIPLTGGAMGTPRQVAHLAIFLASDLASHITGTPVWIDGAQSLLQG